MTQACTVLVCAGLTAMPLTGEVKITPSGDKVAVRFEGNSFTNFYMTGAAFRAKVAKPYLRLLRAASGLFPANPFGIAAFTKYPSQ